MKAFRIFKEQIQDGGRREGKWLIVWPSFALQRPSRLLARVACEHFWINYTGTQPLVLLCSGIIQFLIVFPPLICNLATSNIA